MILALLGTAIAVVGGVFCYKRRIEDDEKSIDLTELNNNLKDFEVKDGFFAGNGGGFIKMEQYKPVENNREIIIRNDKITRKDVVKFFKQSQCPAVPGEYVSDVSGSIRVHFYFRKGYLVRLTIKTNLRPIKNINIPTHNNHGNKINVPNNFDNYVDSMLWKQKLFTMWIYPNSYISRKIDTYIDNNLFNEKESKYYDLSESKIIIKELNYSRKLSSNINHQIRLDDYFDAIEH